MTVVLGSIYQLFPVRCTSLWRAYAREMAL